MQDELDLLLHHAQSLFDFVSIHHWPPKWASTGARFFFRLIGLPIHCTLPGINTGEGGLGPGARGWRDRTCSIQSKAWSLTFNRSYFPEAVVWSGQTAFSSS